MANKVILTGRVGRDCECKYHNGTAHAEFSLATTEKWTDKDREKQSRTDWHNCQMWGKQAETLSQYIKKGSLLYVEGKIQYREWTNDAGLKQKATNIVVDKVEFLSSARGGSGNNSSQPPQDQQSSHSSVCRDEKDIQREYDASHPGNNPDDLPF